jgi:hypothetical protein
MIGMNDPRYKGMVDGELSKAAEQLYELHHGDCSYVTWYEQRNPNLKLADVPTAIECAVGVLPFEPLAALINFYLALHRLIYWGWASQGNIGAEVFAQLVASMTSGKTH